MRQGADRGHPPRRSAGTPSRPRSAWRPSRRCSRTGCPSAPIGWAPDRTAPRAGGRSPAIREVRGKGLLVGIELDRPAGPIVDACRDRGLLILTAGEKILHDPAAHRGRGRRGSRGGDRGGCPPAGQAVKRLLSIADLSATTSRTSSASPPSGRPGRRPATPDAARRLLAGARVREAVAPDPCHLRGGHGPARGRLRVPRRPGHRTRARESIPDVARNLGRWVDVDLGPDLRPGDRGRARASRGDPRGERAVGYEHPCQALADFFTLWEHGRSPAPASGLDRRRQQRLPLAHPPGQSSRHGDGRGRAAGVRADARVLETARAWAGASR